jgi:hypothetical protein
MGPYEVVSDGVEVVSDGVESRDDDCLSTSSTNLTILTRDEVVAVAVDDDDVNLSDESTL